MVILAVDDARLRYFFPLLKYRAGTVYSWGVTLAKHGDLDGAAAKLKEANENGPRWADPLKAWSEVLITQGKTKEALVKYDAALKYATNWTQLNDALEAAAKPDSGQKRSSRCDARVRRRSSLAAEHAVLPVRPSSDYIRTTT